MVLAYLGQCLCPNIVQGLGFNPRVRNSQPAITSSLSSGLDNNSSGLVPWLSELLWLQISGIKLSNRVKNSAYNDLELLILDIWNQLAGCRMQ